MKFSNSQRLSLSNTANVHLQSEVCFIFVRIEHSALDKKHMFSNSLEHQQKKISKQH